MNTIRSDQDICDGARAIGEMQRYFSSIGVNVVGRELLRCVDFARGRDVPQEEVYQIFPVDRRRSAYKINKHKNQRFNKSLNVRPHISIFS